MGTERDGHSHAARNPQHLFSRVVAPFMSAAMRRANQEDLRRSEDAIESQLIEAGVSLRKRRGGILETAESDGRKLKSQHEIARSEAGISDGHSLTVNRCPERNLAGCSGRFPQLAHPRDLGAIDRGPKAFRM